MRFGRLLFLVHALIGLGPARNNGPRLLVLCRASPPYPPSYRMGKGVLSLLLCISLYAPNRATVIPRRPPAFPFHYSRCYS